MTTHPIDTEALAKRAGHILFTDGPEQPAATAREACVLLDLLATAEHRATRAEAQVSEEKGLRMKATAAATEAEHRIARLEAQSDIRGRAVVIYRERARQAEAERDWNIRSSRNAKRGRIQANARADQAEARVKAVQDLIDRADTAGDWTVNCSRLQWAIDGATTIEHQEKA